MKNNRFQPDVWRLLRQNISFQQLIGYALANMVGLTVILAGLLFYCDSNQNNAEDDQYFSNDYVIISKKVDGLKFDPVAFDEQEVKQIEAQPWAHKVGRFTSSQFAVNGAVDLGGNNLSTYMFFESVADEFFDIKPANWGFDPSEHFVPIIISKDYLTLYNFGFAIPQGLPQISEKIIGAIPIRLRLSGKGMEQEYFEAAIVGFSSRLNTIAVPQSFMDWANARYSDGEQPQPSRLIIRTDPMATSSMEDYLEAHELEIASERGTTAKVADFMSLVSAVTAANGLVISMLALFILMLSIFLLLQKSRSKLRNLMLLGYAPSEVERYYERGVLIANAAITVLALLITFVCRMLWIRQLSNLGIAGAPLWPVVLTALLYFVVTSIINVKIIRRHLLKVWQEP